MINIHGISDVIKLHDSIIEEFGGLPGVRDENLLAAAIERPFIGLANGTEFFSKIEQKAAVLLHSLIQFHPFVDGNKRTAVAVTKIYLLENNFAWEYNQNEIVDFAIAIATGNLDTNEIMEWIRERIKRYE